MKASTSILAEVRKNPSSFTWGPVKEIIDVGRYTFLHVFNADEIDCGYHIFIDGRTIYRHEKTLDEALIVAIAYGRHSGLGSGNSEAFATACKKLLLT